MGRMTLRDELLRSGNWLFRWRSYVPLLFLPVLVFSMRDFHRRLDSDLADEIWELGCLLVAACGMAIRALAVGHAPAGTSGRTTRRQRADVLNTTGLYSVMRHPLYLGNFVIWMGLALFAHTWWLVLIVALAFWLYYERIIYAEEEFLRAKFGAEFQRWADATPCFLPSFRRWQPPALPFSWKSVLAREYSTLFATILTFFFLEVTGDYFDGELPHVDVGWIVLTSLGAVAFLVLRWMKRSGRLTVEGR
jgi:protein-S-isoprenylcysteine O-methyltransferase Ste14